MMIAIALLAAPSFQIRVEGKHVDVYGEREAAEKAAKEADAAGERFRELFGAAPWKAAIILTRDGEPARDATRDKAYFIHGAKWLWRWEPKQGAEPDETMCHALGHLWLLFWVDGGQPKTAQYGSSLPDWVDEGVASLLEGPEAHRFYAAEMKRIVAAEKHLPWRDLFGCIHPDSPEKTEKPKARDRGLFYMESYSILAFMESRYGSKGLRHVAVTLKSGKGFEAALGSDGLPKSMNEMESEWKTWATQ